MQSKFFSFKSFANKFFHLSENVKLFAVLRSLWGTQKKLFSGYTIGEGFYSKFVDNKRTNRTGGVKWNEMCVRRSEEDVVGNVFDFSCVNNLYVIIKYTICRFGLLAHRLPSDLYHNLSRKSPSTSRFSSQFAGSELSCWIIIITVSLAFWLIKLSSSVIVKSLLDA